MTPRLCRWCGRPVLWALTTPASRRMSLDPRANPRGSMHYVRTPAGWRIARVAGRDGVPAAERYMPHVATCPTLAGTRTRRGAAS